MGENRRIKDTRIEEIHKDVKEIRDILLNEQGVCVRLSVSERANESTQKELTEHKSNHWQYIIVLTAIAGVAVGIIELIKGKL